MLSGDSEVQRLATVIAGGDANREKHVNDTVKITYIPVIHKGKYTGVQVKFLSDIHMGQI